MKGQASFHASHAGWCRGCKGRIAKGENVWSPGVKGQWYTGTSQGMFHIHCEPEVVVRKMSELELALHRERLAERKKDAYR